MSGNIDYGYPDYTLKTVENAVDEAPDVKTKITVSGYIAKIVEGNDAEGVASKIKVKVDGTSIELVSMIVDTNELEKIARSMI